MNPKISIILPVYNAEKYIKKCITSILNQTFHDFELIIIDDGSKDNSAQMCDVLATKDDRIVVVHKPNGGVASARQLGVDIARGIYSIHADSDDWVESDMLECIYKVALERDADIVIADYYKEINGQQHYIAQNFEDGNARDALLGMCQNRVFGALWHKLVRHSLYKQFNVRFVEGINYCEDLLVMTKFMTHDINVTKINRAFYHYNGDNEGSLTKDPELYVSSILKYFEHQKLILPEKHYRIEYYCIFLDIIQNCFRKGFVDQEYFEAHDHSTWKDIKHSNVRTFFKFILMICHLFSYKTGYNLFCRLKNNVPMALTNVKMGGVIVIGGNHHNTLGVIRSLGYAGIKPIVILHGTASDAYVGHSRYIKQLIKVADVNCVIDALRRICLLKNIKPVIIACSDGASSILDQYYDELSARFLLPGCKIQGSLTMVMDKQTMTELGKTVGFNVPDSWIVEYKADIVNIEYPCITKPILSKDGSKSDIQICHSEKELLDVINDGSCYRYQVQRYIEKDFEYQLIGLSLNGGKDLIIPGISRCIRPCPGTNTGFLRYMSIDSFVVPIEQCKEFVKKVGYSGLFSIEFLRDKTGVDYFMEMNFRNDGNSICVTKSGYNLPYLWYAFNTGLDYKAILSSCVFHEVLVMPELDDFNRFVKTRKISLSQWLRDLRNTDAFMEYDSNDRIPFWIALRQYAFRGIRKLLKI